jgi:EAL domain-containing protein (putative c-di-GMP-specific phosphodiesterase class I)/GGDEF domain-containing protein
MEPHAYPHLKQLDPVTFLPNRQQFTADYRAQPGAQLILVSISEPRDYDQLLRAIGPEYSDEFLRACASRLRDALMPEIPIYHVGILGYAFIMPDGILPELLQSITDKFNKPLTCGRIPLSADVALGVVDCQDGDASFLLRAALTAVRDCRDSGRDWSRYNPKTDTAHQRGFLLLSSLNAAMQDNDQLALHYQPKYDMRTGAPTSAEALLRWKHPVFGNISPAEFIPLAEATAHIHPLTDWVLRTAIAQAGAWAAKGINLNIAINVSPRNLARRGFAARVGKILACYGVPPSRIELEFTEGVLVSNDPVVLEELQALRNTGIRIALDDFGTGFSNFSYITHLPADILKIDKSFIQRIGSDERAAMVVRSLIELAHRLDYSVVAEGIESERVFALLKSWDCDEAQGFYMSPPLDVTRFVETLELSTMQEAAF